MCGQCLPLLLPKGKTMAHVAPASYSIPQKALHWLMALLILFNLIFSDAMEEVAEAYERGEVPSPEDLTFANIHAYVGIAVLCLGLIRLAVRLTRGAPAASARIGTSGFAGPADVPVIDAYDPVYPAFTPPENFATLGEHRVEVGDRLDNLAARYLGDPLASPQRLHRCAPRHSTPRNLAEKGNQRLTGRHRCSTSY